MVGCLDTQVWFQQDFSQENLDTTFVKTCEPRTIAEPRKIAEYIERSFALAEVVRCTSLDVEEPSEPANREAYLKDVLEKYTQRWLERTEHHLGYPLNLDFDYSALGDLNRLSLNNVGDPFIEGGYGVQSRDFEVGVLDWFARFWEIKLNEYWGYTTNGGSEGNLHGLLLGRQKLPDGILYASKESHYSVFKAAFILRMNSIEVKTLTSGEIDCSDLKVHLLQNKDKPAILNINIGTTVKGAIDDLDLTIQTLRECGFPRDRFYIHCDGALSSIMLPFQDQVPRVTFTKPIDSISVSGHKFIGCPMPCGVQIARIEHIKEFSKDHEYIASRDATITGSRNGHTPIFLWYALNRKGYKGLQKDVQQCLHNAKYLKDRLKAIGVSAMLNKASIIVVFERPRDEEFIRRWQLACRENVAHVCVMPHVTIEKLNTFLVELIVKRLTWYTVGGEQPPCIASDIGKENCACLACASG